MKAEFKINKKEIVTINVNWKEVIELIKNKMEVQFNTKIPNDAFIRTMNNKSSINPETILIRYDKYDNELTRQKPTRKPTKEPKTSTVHSSYGDITIDSITGDVLKIDCIDSVAPEDKDVKYLSDIKRFDLWEYKKYYKHPTIKSLPSSFDILDLGFWSKGNKYKEVYCNPEEDFRKEIKRSMKEEAACPYCKTILIENDQKSFICDKCELLWSFKTILEAY